MVGRPALFHFVNRIPRLRWLVLAGWLVFNPPAIAQESLPPPPMPVDAPTAQAGADPNAEVLTRGPIHEAYAMPVTDTTGTGLVVPKRPPNPIEEQAPDVKPQGDSAAWIPGYWSWEDERKDFIWISGVWRVPPPGQRWVPGYWQEGQGGWNWVSGYWMPNAKTEAVYLPKPPATVEQGPTSPAPGESNFWVPGHWQWIADRYVWVPGYWAVSRPNLVWVYPTYSWTPRGWVYCEGYWDYPLEQRGLLFAPVYFAQPVVYYRPAVCVDVGIVTGSLFCRPVYHHYYFGDYYADSYVAIGIQPWFVYCGPRYGYDPLFCYYRWHHRHDPHWESHLHGWHNYYRAHPEMRPPHTLAQQQRLLADPRSKDRPDSRNMAVGHPVGQLKDRPGSPIHVQPVSANQRAAVQQSAKQVTNFKNERLQMESQGKSGGAGRAGGASGPATPDRVNLSRMSGFQAAGTRTAGPPTQGRPTQRPSPRSNGAPGGQERAEGQGRQDSQPRSEFQPRSDFQSRSEFQPRSDFQSRQDFPSRQGLGPAGRSPRGGR